MQTSFSAKFHLGASTYKILTCNYLFYQDTDALGNAVAKVRSGEIELVLEGSDDTTLMSWAADPLRRLDGKMVFAQGDLLSGVAEKLSFSDGSCVEYTEQFEPGNPFGSYLYQLKIIANQIILNGLEHSNEWPDYA